MQSAEASVPQPMTGMPASSQRPWTVPSSPKRPCSTGKAASSLVVRTPFMRNSTMPCRSRSGEMTAGTHFERSALQLSSSSASAPP